MDRGSGWVLLDVLNQKSWRHVVKYGKKKIRYYRKIEKSLIAIASEIRRKIRTEKNYRKLHDLTVDCMQAEEVVRAFGPAFVELAKQADQAAIKREK